MESSKTHDRHSLLLAEGWTALTDDGFVGMVGPFYQKVDGAQLRFRFPVEKRHQNLRGVAQGGALMTFSDRVMGIVARSTTESKRTATVQFGFQFIDAVHIGDLVEASPAVVRGTKHLIFVSAVLMVEGRTVGIANGVWKRLGPARSVTSS